MSVAQSVTRPSWIYNKPETINDTYYYQVGIGVGETELEAKNFAIADIYQKIATTIGQPINSDEINKFLQNAKVNYDVIPAQYNIPMYETCTPYVERTEDGSYRVYVLYQIAKSGNSDVSFDYGFSDCYRKIKIKNTGNADKLYVDGLNVMRYGYNLSEQTVENLFWGTRSYKIYKKSYDCDRGGMGLAIGGACLGCIVGLPIFCFTDFRDFPDGAFITSMAFFAVSITMVTWGFCKTFDVVAKNKVRRAVRIYNRNSLSTNYSSSLSLNLTNGGVGMTYKF